ncbi:MAG: DoxX family protein [Propioniciclava sp.]
MTIALWIASGLLAALYLGAGAMKAIRSKDQLAENMDWVNDFSAGTVRFIGIVEVLGGLGLILPWLTGIAPVLTPLAAAGLVIVQVLAIALHVRRGEMSVLGMNVVLLAAALFIAVFRFMAL